MTPLQHYQERCKQDNFLPDAAQEQALIYIEDLFKELKQVRLSRVNRLYQKLIHKVRYLKTANNNVKGIYLWGGVGRGKTYLMNSFFHCLPFDNKLRLHFYRFMQLVHDELKPIQHTPNPLKIVAESIAKRACIICLDEFHVADITDAMLLSELFSALFSHNVVLFTTSNESPDELYQNGLQREKFLPTIELIKQHTHVVNLDSETDYRIQFFSQAERYYYPESDTNKTLLADHFSALSADPGKHNKCLIVQERNIRTIQASSEIAWFDFATLCVGARAVADYIELACRFHTILISAIPLLDDTQPNETKRFIMLIDEFYDRHVKLILEATAEPQLLYQGKKWQHEWQRTASRLEEIRSFEYLSKPHLSD